MNRCIKRTNSNCFYSNWNWTNCKLYYFHEYPIYDCLIEHAKLLIYTSWHIAYDVNRIDSVGFGLLKWDANFILYQMYIIPNEFLLIIESIIFKKKHIRMLIWKETNKKNVLARATSSFPNSCDLWTVSSLNLIVVAKTAWR